MNQLRPYQERAVQAIFRYWAEGGGNALIEMATGTGKSLVIASLVKRLLGEYPDVRILMLVHVRELVRQNVEEMLSAWPDAPVGVNSASLGRRDYRHPIIFASIQSVFRRPDLIAPRDLILVDEAHMISAGADGMYRTLIAALQAQTEDIRIAGLTATPYRLSSGRLDRGEDRLFDRIVYSYDIGSGVADGYLVPLIARAGDAEIRVQGVERRGGEFVESQLAEIAENADLVRAAVGEIVAMGINRRAWIAFCVTIAHCHRVCAEVRRHGITCAVITSKKPKVERDSIISMFKAGQIRCLVSVNVLSIGFNAPQVDLIALLRPTLSTGLYVQQLGRGTRCVGPDIKTSIANGKSDCVVLDFSGNVRRHGPVDAIAVEPISKTRDGDDRTGTVKPDTVQAKVCPLCKTFASVDAAECANPNCDYEWPLPKPTHEAKPDLDAVIMTRHAPAPVFRPVTDVTFNEHVKPDKPPSLRVSYRCGLNSFSEWICLEHVNNYARTRAERWWRAMAGNDSVPDTVADALFRTDELLKVIGITVKEDGGYWRVSGYRVTDDAGNVFLIDGNFRVRTEPRTGLGLPAPPSVMIDADTEIPF